MARQPGRPSPVQRALHGGDCLDADTGVSREILQDGENLGFVNVQVLAQEVAITDGVEIPLFGIDRDFRHSILIGDQQAQEFTLRGLGDRHLRHRFLRRERGRCDGDVILRVPPIRTEPSGRLPIFRD